MRGLTKSVLSLLAVCCLVFFMTGCGSDTNTPTSSTQAPIGVKTLDSAASFLGAATGKEYPITIDAVIFVNSVLGINNVSSEPKDLYGDLWILLRDPYGVPILDANGCSQPIASEPIDIDGKLHYTVPMVLEEYMDGSFKCAVVEGYEHYTIPLDIGRLNMVRSSVENPDMFARAFEEVMTTINNSDLVKTDVAGRLVLVSGGVESTIDAPRDNLALYKALMVEGRLAGYGVAKIGDEGQPIPAPWLEVRKSLNMGDLAYLRDGTPGRDHGVDLINGYADVSRMVHSRQTDYGGKQISYVQYVEGGFPVSDNSGNPATPGTCMYRDETGEAWTRIFGSETYEGANMAAFTRHADDARRVIEFTHNVIQGYPDTGDIAALPSNELINNAQHMALLGAGDPPVVMNPNRHRLFETAASLLGAASNKGVPLKIDGLVFVNTALGLNTIQYDNLGEIYGDLWELVRNDNGVPVLDANGCVQPKSSTEITWPDGTNHMTVPMMLDASTGECIVVADYEEYVIEIELGRLNCVRTALTNERVLDHHLYEAVKAINSSVAPIKLDQSGRIVYTVSDESTGLNVDKTIDSPRANMALYLALMKWGKLEGDVYIMQEGTLTRVDIAINPAVDLSTHGLGFLRVGDEVCAGTGPCGYGPAEGSNEYFNYSDATFKHKSQADYDATVKVKYVETQEAECRYIDKEDALLGKVLKNSPEDTHIDGHIADFVRQAEDTRKIIQFIHTKIHVPGETLGD